MYFVCSSCKVRYDNPKKPVWLCECGKPLSVRYNWEHTRKSIDINESLQSLWRYQSVLPQSKEVVSLGEGHTPLQELSQNLFIKNETVNPTGSFKDRGMSLAITMAKEQNVEKICLPSAGNAGVSAAAYCQKAGIECNVFLPETIPNEYKNETEKYGANINLAGKTIAEAGKTMVESKKEENWFDISTLKEPFRVEGKKTLGYEIAEQLGWKFPEVVVYETGGGTGLIGMWKAFSEMKLLGWVTDPLPKMVAAQSSGCAPVVKAFQNREIDTKFWENSETTALGLNVPGPIGGAWILDILRASKGIAIMVEEKEIKKLTSDFNQLTQIESSDEGGVVWGAYNQLNDMGWIKPNQSTILFATGIERIK